MAPVIRISDEVFRKLQLLSEPLVDTPNSVIERLLADVPAATSGRTVTANTSALRAIRKPHEVGGTRSPGLFLAPASVENIRTTLSKAVPLSAVEKRIDAATLERLRAAIGTQRSFQCWAMSTSSRGTYDKMKVGDLVLFTPKGTGRFTYRAKVSGKIESQTLGDILWPITPNQPWSLIYLLEDVKQVDIRKDRLVAEFGYAHGFQVYGITRVTPERVASALSRRGSLENLLAAAASKRAT